MGSPLALNTHAQNLMLLIGGTTGGDAVYLIFGVTEELFHSVSKAVGFAQRFFNAFAMFIETLYDLPYWFRPTYHA